MGVSRRGLDLRVAEELADHRQALASGDRHGGEGVAQVVDTDVLNTGALANTPPGRLQVGQVRAGVLPRDDPGVFVQPFDLGKDLDRRGANVDGLGAGFGIGKVKRHPLEIHVIPLEGHDLGETAAGENQQPQSVDGRLALDAFLLALPQGFAEPSQLLLREVTLPFLLRVLLYVPTGVGAVRAQSPDLGQVEGLGQELEASVGLDGREAEVVMKLGDIDPFDLADPQVANSVGSCTNSSAKRKSAMACRVIDEITLAKRSTPWPNGTLTRRSFH